jgi:hypothetical protein
VRADSKSLFDANILSIFDGRLHVCARFCLKKRYKMDQGQEKIAIF